MEEHFFFFLEKVISKLSSERAVGINPLNGWKQGQREVSQLGSPTSYYCVFIPRHCGRHLGYDEKSQFLHFRTTRNRGNIRRKQEINV